MRCHINHKASDIGGNTTGTFISGTLGHKGMVVIVSATSLS